MEIRFLHYSAWLEVADRFAYYVISSNLISYLMGPLGQSMAEVAENANAWGGAGLLLPSSTAWFLNKALLAPDCSKDERKACSITDVEEAKAVLRLVPVWATSLVYATAFAKSSTFFT